MKQAASTTASTTTARTCPDCREASTGRCARHRIDQPIEPRYIVAAFDRDDLPRAFGIASTVDAAADRAALELDLYRKEKRAIRDLEAARQAFTFKVADANAIDAAWHPMPAADTDQDPT